MVNSIFESSAAKAVGTILLIFVLVFSGMLRFFYYFRPEREDLVFWLKVSLGISAVLAVVFWILIVVYGK